MAVDKLVDSTQLDADLTSVANAIRTKGGTSAQLMFPNGFVSAVEAIVTGGGGITADEIASKSYVGESRSIELESTTTVKNSFAGSNITGISGPNVIAFSGSGAFNGCTSLSTVVFPNLVGAGNTNYSESFKGCTSLTAINAESLPKLSSTWNYFFQNCSNLLTVVLPSFNSENSAMFQGCSRLTTLDVSTSSMTNVGKFSNSIFKSCTALKTLIIRANAVRKLSGTEAFTGTPFASGASGGTLYVPSALIDSYQSATNWSMILGYENNQILPIEGSIYETQYADGTPIE